MINYNKTKSEAKKLRIFYDQVMISNKSRARDRDQIRKGLNLLDREFTELEVMIMGNSIILQTSIFFQELQKRPELKKK